MTLEHCGPHTYVKRLVGCPFCGADLRGEKPAEHLEACEPFRDAWGPDRREPAH